MWANYYYSLNHLNDFNCILLFVFTCSLQYGYISVKYKFCFTFCCCMQNIKKIVAELNFKFNVVKENKLNEQLVNVITHMIVYVIDINV